jgi:serine protease
MVFFFVLSLTGCILPDVYYSISGTVTPHIPEVSNTYSSQRTYSYTPNISQKEIEQGFLDGQYVVLFEEDYDSSALLSVPEVEILDEFYSMDGSIVYAVVKTDNPSFVSGIEGVRSLEPNGIFTLQSEEAIPNDPRYPDQWNYPMIQMPQAWTIAKGSSTVVVAVIDSGVRLDHPDLEGIFLPGYDLINNDDDPTDNGPDQFHGTHVIGTIAAETNNSLGVSGMTWGEYRAIMPIKIFEAGKETTAGILASSIIFAVEHGAKIINMSLAGGDVDVVAAAVKYAEENQVLMIAASGNKPYQRYPALYDEVISVGAVDNTMQRASYSNYGDYLDLVAPGGSSRAQILSTGYSTDGGNTYSYMAGTSMAAPHVTGLAALLMAEGFAGRDSSGEEIIRKILRETALDLGEPGWDQYYGYGLIQAFDALNFNEERRPLLIQILSTSGQVLKETQVEGDGSFYLTGLTENHIKIRIWRDFNGNEEIDKGDLLGYYGFSGSGATTAWHPTIDNAETLSFFSNGHNELETPIQFFPVNESSGY